MMNKNKKSLLPIVFYLCSFLSFSSDSEKLDFFKEKDKRWHASVSFVISSSVYAKTKSWEKGLLWCGVAGIGKEVYDQLDYGGFDMRDIKADAIGCAAGILTTDLALKGLDIKANSIQYSFEF